MAKKLKTGSVAHEGLLTLGTLNESILAFAGKSTSSEFWLSVVENLRWTVPARRLCAVVFSPSGGMDVRVRLERGERLTGCFGGLPEDDPLTNALRSDKFETLDASELPPSDALRQWLAEDLSLCVFMIPVRTPDEVLGALIGTTRPELLTELVRSSSALYAIHVAITYRLIRELEQKRQFHEILEDVNNQLTAARDDAVAADGAKSAFLASMSHELRTPLNAILGFSEILLERAETDGSEGYKRPLSRIHRAGNHLLGLVNGILDLSKIEAGKMEIDLAEVDIAELTHDIVATIEPIVQTHQNKFSFVSEETSQVCTTDRTKLLQVLLNMLSNACKFAEGKEVRLEVRIDETFATRPQVVFRVIDAGIGMDDDGLARLFTAFEQAKDVSARKHGGTGLGMAITHKLVHLLGGDIRVESALGQGTTVEVWFPLSPSEDVQRCARKAA